MGFARSSLAGLVLVVVLAWSNAINFELPSGWEECFYEEAHEGTNIHGAFAVVAGAHLDVDVAVWSPDGRQLYSANREGEGRFMIRADRDGTYKICFSNKMSVMSHKAVKLALNVGEPLDLSKVAKKESMENVERWILSISHTLRMIDFHQQEYRMLHERHLNTVTVTNRRVKWWSFLECLSVMVVSGLQVLFIKRMFNKSSPGVRRMV